MRFHVIPAQAGIQGFQANALRALVSNALDPRLRGDAGGGRGNDDRRVAQ